MKFQKSQIFNLLDYSVTDILLLWRVMMFFLFVFFWVISYLVLQPVSPSLQVHVFSVGIVETAFTQFTVEANHLTVVISNLKRENA